MELPNLGTLLGFISFYLIGLASPGPDFFIVIRQSTRHGAFAGFCCAQGIATGIAGHMALIAGGFGLIVAQSEFLRSVTTVFGGIYLLVISLLSFKSFLEKKKKRLKPISSEASEAIQSIKKWDNIYLKSFALGLLTNLINIKAFLFFIAFMRPFFETTESIFIYSGLSVLLTSFWFSFVGIVLGKQKKLREKLVHSQWVDLVWALAFFAFSMTVLWSLGA